jgi:membrane protease YdiL (CAAX protease family)
MPPAVLLGAASVLYLILFLGAFAWIRFRGDSLALGGRFGAAAELGIGAGAGLALAGASAAVSLGSGAARRLEEEFRALLGPLRPPEALFLALLSGFVEEVVFRAGLQPAVGLVWASLVFGLLHVGPKRIFLLWTLFAVGMGFLLGWLFAWTEGLAAPVSLHVTLNAVNLARLGRLQKS